MDKRKRLNRKIAFWLPMILYFVFFTILLVTRLLVFSLITGNEYYNPQHFPRQYNLVPFKTISLYINPAMQRMVWLPVIGNILLFVPLGTYIHALSKKKRIWLSTVLALLAIILVESAQFVLATGTFDIDDILLNFIGAFAGVWIYQFIHRRCGADDDASKTVLSVISMAVIPLLGATIIQSILWLPMRQIIPACLLAFAAAYIAMYFFLWRRETKSIKILFALSSGVLCLVFFFFILRMI